MAKEPIEQCRFARSGSRCHGQGHRDSRAETIARSVHSSAVTCGGTRAEPDCDWLLESGIRIGSECQTRCLECKSLSRRYEAACHRNWERIDLALSEALGKGQDLVKKRRESLVRELAADGVG
jgi:hypothetical protein